MIAQRMAHRCAPRFQVIIDGLYAGSAETGDDGATHGETHGPQHRCAPKVPVSVAFALRPCARREE